MNIFHEPWATHKVTNQPPSLIGYNAFSRDAALQASLPADLASVLRDKLQDLGGAVGDEQWIDRGFKANENPPVLNGFDRFGHRIDEVDFHPAYHQLMQLGMGLGIHSTAWTHPVHGHVARAAMQFLLTQLEPGVCCPLAMTNAAHPVLMQFLSSDDIFRTRSIVDEYDQRFMPASAKRSITIGMAMTEKQGGSDVRVNSTEARRLSERADSVEYCLRGHKWFCSAPMSDGFLTLAQASGGITCFLVPRFCEDGTRNRIFIQRLKNKLGNRSNASAEIEYLDTWARRLGEEGEGVTAIIEMVQNTRLDAAVAPAGMMRQALVQAIHHARHRKAFGKLLIEQPLMRNVLTDLALESEAATLLAMRIAKAVDDAMMNSAEKAFARLATIIGKFWINKLAPQFIYEAMECHGGGGYIEESMLPRLYREAPVNSIWEGSGNVICLDLLRVIQRAPHCLETFNGVVKPVLGEKPVLRQRFDRLQQSLARCQQEPALLRCCVENMALLLQCSLLREFAPESMFDLFVDSRLEQPGSRCYGTLADIRSAGEILDRAWAG
ncbi:acyl-CoA dehydrogenase family protein [Granulosicoccus sp. 3-233]|uniref:acyl-CoA dehydrogenase family protein n=1 Tax=Granulosicoccus sp. 3-233 TaxID=3417969 RepID=UPI003D351C95